MARAAIDAESISTDDLLKLDNQLCFPLYACSKEVVRRYSPHLNKLGLTYTQYLVMMALWEYESLSVGELGERLYLDSGTLTPLLKKMEEKGFITRQRSESDERRVNVCLTDKGKALKHEAREVPLAMGQCVDLSVEDAQTLMRILRHIIDNVREA